MFKVLTVLPLTIDVRSVGRAELSLEEGVFMSD